MSPQLLRRTRNQTDPYTAGTNCTEKGFDVSLSRTQRHREINCKKSAFSVQSVPRLSGFPFDYGCGFQYLMRSVPPRCSRASAVARPRYTAPPPPTSALPESTPFQYELYQECGLSALILRAAPRYAARRRRRDSPKAKPGKRRFRQMRHKWRSCIHKQRHDMHP